MQKKKTKKFSSFFITFFFAAILVIVSILILKHLPDEKAYAHKWYDSIANQSVSVSYHGEAELYSKNVIMINATKDQICCEKNSLDIVPIASLTKIMTTLVAIETLNSLDEQFTFTSEIVRKMDEEHASVADFAVGECVSARDMLYGIMLPSGGDAALGIACLISGSEENYVSLMNTRAEEAGLRNTHFSNVTGLDGKDNYSTAADIAVLMCEALENDEFRNIASTEEYLTAATPQHPDGILLKSTLSGTLSDYSLSDIVSGGKTGFTPDAGQCLASFANFAGDDYILVTLGAGEGTNSPKYSFADAGALYGEFLK